MLQCRCSCGQESSAQQSIEDLIVVKLQGDSQEILFGWLPQHWPTQGRQNEERLEDFYSEETMVYYSIGYVKLKEAGVKIPWSVWVVPKKVMWQL